MNPATDPITPEWKWATPEGSRQFDRLADLKMTLREILEWQEEAETLTLKLEAARRQAAMNR